MLLLHIALTPYSEAPALKVSLNASAAKVVYPPAEPPVMHNLSPSTFPLSALKPQSHHHMKRKVVIVPIIKSKRKYSDTKNLAQLQQSSTSVIPQRPSSRSRYSRP